MCYDLASFGEIRGCAMKFQSIIFSALAAVLALGSFSASAEVKHSIVFPARIVIPNDMPASQVAKTLLPADLTAEQFALQVYPFHEEDPIVSAGEYYLDLNSFNGNSPILVLEAFNYGLGEGLVSAIYGHYTNNSGSGYFGVVKDFENVPYRVMIQEDLHLTSYFKNTGPRDRGGYIDAWRTCMPLNFEVERCRISWSSSPNI